MKPELIEPSSSWQPVSFEKVRLMDEEARLRSELQFVTDALWRIAFGRDWADAAPECRCGLKMQRLRIPYHNSGTSRVAFACPEADIYKATGHQWVVTTSPEHYLETNGECCGGFAESMEVCG